MKYILFSLSLLFASLQLIAQTDGYAMVNGQKIAYTLDECGDTLYISSLNDVSVSSLRDFKDKDELKRYRRFRRYAVVVHPYAIEAIRIFKAADYATNNMKKRKRKKYMKKLQKDLKKEFQDPLKKLTKQQGYILVKMIEKELDTPMHKLIKNLRGAFTATYWSTFGRAFGYKLKKGYIPGEDPILDLVLTDLELKY